MHHRLSRALCRAGWPSLQSTPAEPVSHPRGCCCYLHLHLQAFLWGSLTGFAEPLGGLIGYIAVHEQVRQGREGRVAQDGCCCFAGACDVHFCGNIAEAAAAAAVFYASWSAGQLKSTPACPPLLAGPAQLCHRVWHGLRHDGACGQQCDLVGC